MIRTGLLLAAVLSSALTAVERGPIVADMLHGTWVIDAKALKPGQKDAAAAAKAVAGYGITFTLRTCRVTLGADRAYAGRWRVDAATAGAATIVIDPKDGEERRLPIAFDGKHLVVTDAPGALPLIKDPR